MEIIMRKIIETCPTCGDNKLVISEVRCATCGTQVRSRYSPCPFCALNEEQQTLLLLFVRSRGNLKDIEKTLGISYPTVRAKLDELIERLSPPAPGEATDQRKTVLAMVQAGQLSPGEALARLRTPATAAMASDESYHEEE